MELTTRTNDVVGGATKERQAAVGFSACHEQSRVEGSGGAVIVTS